MSLATASTLKKNVTLATSPLYVGLRLITAILFLATCLIGAGLTQIFVWMLIFGKAK